MVHAGEANDKGELLERVALGGGDVAGFLHLVEDDVAATPGALIAADGIVVAGVLAHADQRSSLFDREGLRGLPEIDAGGGLDTDGVIEKVELVQVHVDNLFLRVVPLELDGNHPLDRLLEEALHHIVGIRREELLRQLLGNRTAAAAALLHQDSALDNGTHQAGEVDAAVLGEADVFSRYQCLDEVGREVVVVHIDAVITAVGIAAERLAIGGDHLRGVLVDGVFQLFHGGHVADGAVGYRGEYEDRRPNSEDEQKPEERYNSFRYLRCHFFSFFRKRCKGT